MGTLISGVSISRGTSISGGTSNPSYTGLEDSPRPLPLRPRPRPRLPRYLPRADGSCISWDVGTSISEVQHPHELELHNPHELELQSSHKLELQHPREIDMQDVMTRQSYLMLSHISHTSLSS